MARLSRDAMPRRRLEAAQEPQETTDWGAQTRIAQRYGVSAATASRWNTTLETKRLAGLRQTNPPGRESYLAPDQWTKLAALLKQGATAHGYKTDLWTSPRVRGLIQEKFKVDFNETNLRQALKERLGIARERPRRIARERDEEKPAAWIGTTWVEPKKGRSKE